LLFLGVRVELIDFPEPTGPRGDHPALLDMIENHFGGLDVVDSFSVIITERLP
jgi:hypothetical protein